MNSQTSAIQDCIYQHLEHQLHYHSEYEAGFIEGLQHALYLLERKQNGIKQSISNAVYDSEPSTQISGVLR